ncbi:hypothetical protein HK102_009460 [Quaeritorhiza haematococci]|nr:hypothetical protein HK102_009460 [Quaeritorhiza haematococci]
MDDWWERAQRARSDAVAGESSPSSTGRTTKESSSNTSSAASSSTASTSASSYTSSATKTPVFTFPSVPGLLVIPNPFTPSAQRRIIKACLKSYSRYPHLTNLDKHYDVPKEGLWEPFEDWTRKASSRSSTKGSESGGEEGEPMVRLKRNKHAQSEAGNASNGTTNDQAEQLDTPLLKDLPISLAVHRWRWALLGLSYDWSKKEYSSSIPSPSPYGSSSTDRAAANANADPTAVTAPPIPPLLARLASTVIRFTEGITGYDSRKYVPEAGVVNYYSMKDALMAHQDRSEENMEAPLVSFSFGHACIYLIGTTTVNDPPTPFILRSGDVVIMSGSSRRAFHGVPRILENTLPEYLYPPDIKPPSINPTNTNDAEEEEEVVEEETAVHKDGCEHESTRNAEADSKDEWTIYGHYMMQSRININLRQFRKPV